MPDLKDPDTSFVAAESRSETDAVIPASLPWRPAAYLWSLLALLVGLTVSYVVHQQHMQRLQMERKAVRDELAGKSYEALQNRLLTAESLLRAVQTLFLASDEVTAIEFNNFYTNMHPRSQFPGLLALAYAQREGDRYVTRWVEPQPGNQAVVGLDVGAQPQNFVGLLASRDNDQISLSAPFRSVQQSISAEPEDGITLRLPVFTPGSPPVTVDERRQRMRGSIAVSFGVSRMMGEVVPKRALSELHLRITDVTGPTILPVFDSRAGRAAPSVNYDFERRLTYGGRVWNVQMQPWNAGPVGIGWNRSTLPAGVLASLLLALLVYSMVSTRQRALELGWRMSRRYRESEERFRALNELLPALVLVARAEDGRITYANQASRDRLGTQVTERYLPELFDDPALRAQLAAPDSEGSQRVDALLHNGEGVRFWASVAISRICLNGVTRLLMVAGDISEQRQLTDLLSHQASHDALTELYNRREFERRLQLVLSTTTADTPPSALLYLDLDQFKLINDTSGHLAGDQLLTHLAVVMERNLGNADVLARLGGDEFGVLVLNVDDHAAAEAIAERLRRCIDGYVFVWEERSYMVSASIGGVVLDRSGLLVKDVLAQADTACYMAKELGRNRVHFYSQGHDETVRRESEMEWANRLRWAVDEHRLVLTYQEIWPLPLVEGNRPSVELLLRFRDESGQLVVPGVFMPAAERYGLMPTVDRWVVETALANFDQLHPSGAGLGMVAINLSGATVEDDMLADRIIELLQRYRVTPSRVCFEITETVAVRNLSQVVRFMERLRAVGCRISLDDFGAGMSSFTYLKNLPLDVIKIDGSFVRDMLTDPVSYLIVKAVTDIGHRLGLLVVAEWVTDMETVQALTELEVNFVQGFSLHHPELAVFQRR